MTYTQNNKLDRFHTARVSVVDLASFGVASIGMEMVSIEVEMASIGVEMVSIGVKVFSVCAEEV
jgi:hypothetical protein